MGPDDLVPGGIIGIQTFGQLIHFHPHLHGLVTDGAFTADGQFVGLPRIDDEPFLQLWQQRVFELLLDEGKIEPKLVHQMQSWRHSGFSVHRSVCLDAGDRDGIERLVQYLARCPFSLARLIRITESGKVLYKAEKPQCHRFPKAASEDLFGGLARNFQLFEPLDFLAELTQHIPNKGEHLIRYYGWYSNKSRGLRAKQGAGGTERQDARELDPTLMPTRAQARRRWAILIKRVYEADPLQCPRCGGQMRIICFIEAHQAQVIERILRHCGLWSERSPRAPPQPGLALVPNDRPAQPRLDVDPDFLEQQRWEQLEMAFEA